MTDQPSLFEDDDARAAAHAEAIVAWRREYPRFAAPAHLVGCGPAPAWIGHEGPATERQAAYAEWHASWVEAVREWEARRPTA